jgi:orotidine-5'-phosphate decarboxylase
MISFADRLTEAVRASGAAACVGLDPHVDRLPEPLVREAAALTGADRRAALAHAARTFCLGVVEVVAELGVPTVKPQVAFFEALGAPGVAALEDVVHAARDAGLIVVLDAKRGDIGSTARAYTRATLDDDGPLGADSVTLSPYLGVESLEPFLDATAAGKGIFVLVRTSNAGAGQWQLGGQHPIAERVASWINAANAKRLGQHGMGPVGAVIGATLPLEAPHWRAAMPRAWFLVPGYGAQGASAADCRGHLRDDGLGALVVSARGVLYGASERAGEDWKDGVRSRASAFVTDLRQNLRRE